MESAFRTMADEAIRAGWPAAVVHDALVSLAENQRRGSGIFDAKGGEQRVTASYLRTTPMLSMCMGFLPDCVTTLKPPYRATMLRCCAA
mgnify:CR=1 FL=1